MSELAFPTNQGARTLGSAHRLLGQRLKLRYTPEVIFRLDESAEYSIHISEVLDKIKDKDKADEREKGN